jgi:hypothetical protein
MAAKEGLQSFYSGLSSGLVRAVISGGISLNLPSTINSEGGRLLLYNQMKLQVGKESMEKNGEIYRPVLGVLAGMKTIQFSGFIRRYDSCCRRYSV